MPYTEKDFADIDKYAMIDLIHIRGIDDDKAFAIQSSLQAAIAIHTKNPNILLKCVNAAGDVYQFYGYYKKPIGTAINKDLVKELKTLMKGFLMGMNA